MLMNFHIEKEIKNRFHVYCIENNTTMSDVIREFILTSINAPSIKKEGSWNVDLVDRNKMENIRWEDTY
jgi:hypothetical protein